MEKSGTAVNDTTNADMGNADAATSGIAVTDMATSDMAATNPAVTCTTCFHRCVLKDGQVGFCRARMNRQGIIVPLGYESGMGRLSALALDPIEKKPLARFMPGSRILSVGGWGCNMRCPFCQNYEISQHTPEVDGNGLTPQELVSKALSLRGRGNIGLAYTYNEPLVSWEYLRDCAMLVRQAGMKNVIVTNGCISTNVLDEILPYTDAMNIDLKCFSSGSYRKLGGDLGAVKDAISMCHNYGQAYEHGCIHIELTTLIVPGFNDSEEEMAEEAAWIASLDRNIPLHLTRFFPRWKMESLPATPVETLCRLAELARRELSDVLLGNV